MKPLRSLLPVYPRAAAQSNQQGEVSSMVRTSAAGAVEAVQVLGGEPPLAGAAADAVRKWRFQPCRRSGRTIGSFRIVTLRFSLPDTVEDISEQAADIERQRSAARAHLDQAGAEKLLVKKVYPDYSPLLSISGIRGTVILRTIVGADGHVRRVIPVRGHPSIMEAAIEALRKARFRPYEVDGQAVEFDTEIAFSFPPH